MGRVAATVAMTIVLAAGIQTGWSKRALGHEDFDSWKGAVNYGLSRDGEWSAYAVNPQEGDGELYFRNTKTGKSLTVPRGYQPSFTADGKYAVALIKPLYADTRNAKIAKKKDHEMPTDSMIMVDLKTLKTSKVASVKNYKIGKDGGVWVAWTSCDTAFIKPKQLKDKEINKPLVVMDMATGSRKVLKYVKHYEFSRDGKRLGITVIKPDKDSTATNSVGFISLPDTSYVVVDRDKRFYSAPVMDDAGNRLAYSCSDDTIKSGTKNAKVYVSDMRREMNSPHVVVLLFKVRMGYVLRPNEYTKLQLSHTGRRLIAGGAPVIAPDDTTVYDFETGKLDIWRWDAPMTPPQERHYLDDIKKASLPVAVNLDNWKQVLISDNILEEVHGGDRWDSDWALVIDPTETMVQEQWDYFTPTKMLVIDVNTGERKKIGMFMRDQAPVLSPEGKYVAWFNNRTWYVYDIVTGTTADVGANVPAELWNTLDEHPSPSMAWGAAGWTKGDGRFLVYDKNDIWSLDPKGKGQPVNLTSGCGAESNLRIRYESLDPERRYISEGDLMTLALYDYKNKYYGLGWLRYGKDKAPHFAVLDGHSYTRVRRTKEVPVFTWERGNIEEIPEIWLSRGTEFSRATQLTDVNSQLKDFKWGTAQLVKWHAYDGKETEGVLYVPEDLDTSKQYPMLCVFYETGTEDLYSHYVMQPSWSWVNYPFYVSRGYVVFVPDIHYTSGRPGEDAYNYVCSGVEEMCRRYPWINKDKIGIDGQSWGGYQTAFLVTRTNMFACAGSGAPVANMTSAYGGIRWESGSSRQGQYEQGQSRIGGNLWDKTQQYIANSPVFYADRVNTPLLIMHNDNDGAVPWYQGIEMFMALRRLQKPVWMMQYNGESHNIKARKNRKDITKRLQQFFDHYLKDDPMPKWMKEGVPMIRKGQEFGFELMEEQ